MRNKTFDEMAKQVTNLFVEQATLNDPNDILNDEGKAAMTRFFKTILNSGADMVKKQYIGIGFGVGITACAGLYGTYKIGKFMTKIIEE